MQIEAQESLDLTHLSASLSQEEISRLSGICKKNERLPGSKKELADCVRVLQDERQSKKQSAADVGSMSDEDFLAAIRSAQKKK